MRLLKAVVLLIIVCMVAGTGFVYLAPQKATSLAFDLERKRSGLEKKEIKLSDNIRYVYLEGGNGEPLMLLHGFGADKENFTRAARFLTPHYRVIIPDHIGFGESSHPGNEDYGSEAQAVRIRMLAQALGIKEVHVGGSSMGGHIAMMYAYRYPEEVKSLWLIDPGGIWSAPQSELHEIIAKTGKNPLMAKSADEFAEIFKFVMADHPFIPRPILNVMAQERIRNYELEQRIFKQLSSDSSEKYIKEIKTPTLIVWGEKDRVLSPETAPILNKLLQNSEVIIMKGLGHLPMVEQPKASAEDYLHFRARLDEKKS